MLPDLELLPPDKQREPDAGIAAAHIETLLLLSTTPRGRTALRGAGVYPVVRATHLHTHDSNGGDAAAVAAAASGGTASGTAGGDANVEALRDACERLVQLLMRDEAPAGGDNDDADAGNAAGHGDSHGSGASGEADSKEGKAAAATAAAAARSTEKEEEEEDEEDQIIEIF
jgi:hypothetical protein